MFRHGEISTETDRGPFFFTLAALVTCLTAAVLFFVFGKGDGLAVFAGILLSVVALASGATLFALVTDRAYVEDGVLHMRYLFRSARVHVEDIGKICLKDEEYAVYNPKGDLLGTINGKLTGIGKVVHELDRLGVTFR
ncbi:MAG: hypothetical protein J6U26_02270 [Lachnospiraceae bacterium]|nr:hypothetical protein [Lachnospiraceae bacterium]